MPHAAREVLVADVSQSVRDVEDGALGVSTFFFEVFVERSSGNETLTASADATVEFEAGAPTRC